MDILNEILALRLPEARREVGNLALTDPECKILNEFDNHFAVVTAALKQEPLQLVEPGVAIQALIKATRSAERLSSMRPDSGGDEPQIAWIAATLEDFWDEVGCAVGISGKMQLALGLFTEEHPIMLLVEPFLTKWFLKN